MSELHEIINKCLIEFDKICKQYNLEYYMLGGTMLGAVRHQGIIPWDDDADIGLPRKDYEKLIEVMSHISNSNYILRNYRNSKNCPFSFSRFEDKNTTLIEKDRGGSDYVGGIYIDIFPLDGTSHFYLLRKLHSLRILFYRYVFYATFAELDANRSFIKYIIIKLIKNYGDSNKIAKKLDKIISKYDYSKSHYVCNHLGRWQQKETIEKKFFAPPKKYLFNNYYLNGVNDAKKYLTSLYGEDYMTPPSRNNMIGHHIPKYINTNLSFKDYKNK